VKKDIAKAELKRLLDPAEIAKVALLIEQEPTMNGTVFLSNANGFYPLEL
jgi:hypothetical protein